METLWLIENSTSGQNWFYHVIFRVWYKLNSFDFLTLVKSRDFTCLNDLTIFKSCKTRVIPTNKTRVYTGFTPAVHFKKNDWCFCCENTCLHQFLSTHKQKKDQSRWLITLTVFNISNSISLLYLYIHYNLNVCSMC